MGSDVQEHSQDGGHPMLRRRMMHLLCLFVIATFSTLGCFQKDPYVVPEVTTAREQAEIAREQVVRAGQTIDPDIREEERDKAIAALKSVVERFPDDREYTPAAHVTMGDLLQEMDRYHEAEKIYRNVIAKYPEIDDVNAQALYGLALSLEELERPAQSKQVLRQLIDSHEDSTNPIIKSLVNRARARYRIIQ